MFKAYGYYIYLEVSGAIQNASARFISGSIPATTATGGKCLRFWYHMYGPHVNALNVYVKVGSHVGAAVWNRNGTRGDTWHLGSVTVRSPYFFNVSCSCWIPSDVFRSARNFLRFFFASLRVVVSLVIFLWFP